MANDCIPFYEPAERVTGHAAVAITGKRFVAITGRQAGGSPGLSTGGEGGDYVLAIVTAAAKAVAVAAHDAAIGEKVTLIMGSQIVPVTAGATVTAGSEVEVDSVGRVINLAAGKAVGLALTGNTVGLDVEVKLYA